MNKKALLTIAAAIGISAVATPAMSAPLPAGTKLAFAPWVYPPIPPLDGTGCTFGSCFGMGVFGTFYAWTALDLGTDGGLIVGKAQKSGGQEVDLASTNPGELTAMWDFGGNHGTFFTAPDASKNIFSDTSCTGSACGSNTVPRITDLAVWNTAWGQQVIPMGSAAGCNKSLLSNCTADMVVGIFVNDWQIAAATAVPRTFSLRYDQIVPAAFPNFPFRLLLRGTIVACNCGLPVVSINGSTAVANLTTTVGTPVSFTISVIDPDGPAAPTCRVVFTTPANGTVALAGCTSGTYTPDVGFIGVNSFNIIANDSVSESIPANGGVINVAVIAAEVTASPMVSPTPTNTPNPVLSIRISPSTIIATSGVPASFIVTNDSASCLTCSVFRSPTNGAVTLNGCSGTYTSANGYTGYDSFWLIASVCGTTLHADLNAGVTVIAPSFTASPMITSTPTNTPAQSPTIQPSPTACTDMYPIKQVTLVGKQGHLSVVVTGNITQANPNGKEIKICPLTTASYTASSNTPGATVVCKVKSNTSRGQGHVRVNDHVKCSDKPVGNDKLYFKIKSGEYKKAM